MKYKLCLALLLFMLIIPANAVSSVSNSFGIINEPNRNSGWMLRYTSGFENTGKAEMRYGFFSDPYEEYLESVKAYMGKDDTVKFFEFAMFDPDTGERIEWNENFNFRFTFDASGMGTGMIINYIGKEYRLYLLDNGSAVSVPVLNSDIESFTAEIDSLGVYALIYNRNALTFNFIYEEGDDKDIIYAQYENLNPQSVISLPEVPQKEGYEFAGWKYSYGSTSFEYIMEENMTFGDVGGRAVAVWTQTLADIGKKNNESNIRYVKIHEWSGDYYANWQGKLVERADNIYPVEEAEKDRLIEIIEKTDGEISKVVNTQYFFYDAETKNVTKILPDNFLVMSDKKSIRLHAPMGIRFRASVLRSAKEERDDYVIEEYGYIVGVEENFVNDDYYDADDLFTLEASGDIASGVAYNRVNGTETLYAQTDDSDVFTCVLHGIPEEHYKTMLVCRPYAKIVIFDMEYIVYGGIMTGSVYDAAKELMEAGTAGDATDVLNSIIEKAEG